MYVSARAEKRNWTGKSYRFKSSHTFSSERQRQTRESVSWYNHDKLCHLHLSLYLIVSSMTNNNDKRQRSIFLCSMDRRRCQNSFSFSLKLSALLLGWNDVVLSWVCGKKLCIFSFLVFFLSSPCCRSVNMSFIVVDAKHEILFFLVQCERRFDWLSMSTCNHFVSCFFFFCCRLTFFHHVHNFPHVQDWTQNVCFFSCVFRISVSSIHWLFSLASWFFSQFLQKKSSFTFTLPHSPHFIRTAAANNLENFPTFSFCLFYSLPEFCLLSLSVSEPAAADWKAQQQQQQTRDCELCGEYFHIFIII